MRIYLSFFGTATCVRGQYDSIVMCFHLSYVTYLGSSTQQGHRRYIYTLGNGGEAIRKCIGDFQLLFLTEETSPNGSHQEPTYCVLTNTENYASDIRITGNDRLV